MKYCSKCGKELYDEAVVCVNCGCKVAGTNSQASKGEDGLALAAKILLIISCVAMGWMIIPLAWCLPITISICGKLKRGEPIGTGLKVCALLFVSVIAGILLLCRSDDEYI